MNSSGFSVNFLQPALAGHGDDVLDTGWTRIFTESVRIVINLLVILGSEPLRFTLDYEEDYQFFKGIIDRAGAQIFSVSDEELVDIVIREKLDRLNQCRVDEYWENFYRAK